MNTCHLVLVNVQVLVTMKHNVCSLCVLTVSDTVVKAIKNETDFTIVDAGVGRPDDVMTDEVSNCDVVGPLRKNAATTKVISM